MPLSIPDVDFLCKLVERKSKNIIGIRQVTMLEQQLVPLAESRGMQSVEQLVEQLRRSYDRDLVDKVAEAVTVNETSFFRDVHPFKTLHTQIIPQIIKQNQSSQRIRIWCGAASSGQEPYSIAMVIREYFPELANWHVNIVATDLSEEMIERTKRGEYSQMEVNRGLPIRKLVRFFDRRGASWIAKDELKQLIDCFRLNLADSWPNMGPFDLIFLRNVLIYFDREIKEQVLTRALQLLNPNGLLFIGGSEMVVGLDLPMKREIIEKTICYRASNERSS